MHTRVCRRFKQSSSLYWVNHIENCNQFDILCQLTLVKTYGSILTMVKTHDDHDMIQNYIFS